MKKVYVGISGGVDSAVSAALLKERGYGVTGVFIKIWRPEFIECTWKEDRIDAMRVCAALDIPFLELDLSEVYKKDIIDTMIRDYSAGITPNPDVLCNRSIKFGGFAQWAFDSGADMIATGHYARTENGKLLRGIDPKKDQSYFMHLVSEKELLRTIFPVGDMHKSDVRALANKFDLPVAKKPDSQGLCFIGDVSIKEFLSKFIELAPGPVLDGSGKKIGVHEGAALYTIGQRHGFTVLAGAAHYVTRVDVENNAIHVSEARSDGAVSKVTVLDMHWISGTPREGDVSIQTRYAEKPIAARAHRRGLLTDYILSEPHIAAPGQSLVAYEGEHCLGGGAISVHSSA